MPNIGEFGSLKQSVVVETIWPEFVLAAKVRDVTISRGLLTNATCEKKISLSFMTNCVADRRDWEGSTASRDTPNKHIRTKKKMRFLSCI
jgi:hypothetical protein